jgi:hypothetical protein
MPCGERESDGTSFGTTATVVEAQKVWLGVPVLLSPTLTENVVTVVRVGVV